MDLFEQAAALIDEEEIILEGKMYTAYGRGGPRCAKFFTLLDRPAKQILNLMSSRDREPQNLDVIRKQYSELKREYDHDYYYKDMPFSSGVMHILGKVMEEFEGGETDWLYAAKWTPLYNWIYDNGDRIVNNSKNPAVLDKLADEYLNNVARPALKKFQTPDAYTQRKNARESVRNLLSDPEFQELLKTRSEGRFDIVKAESDRRPPVIVDNEKRLTLSFRNYEELDAILSAKNSDELYNVVKNQFDSQSGIYYGITDTEIPEGIEFQYQNDAIIACDWSMKNKMMTAGLQRGTYYLSDKKTVVLFVNNGESLRSEFDVGEERSRYVNEFANNNNTLYVALNRNNRFNKFYMSENSVFNVFEIVQDGRSQKYISRGMYMLEDIGEERIKYVRMDNKMDRMAGTVAESALFDIAAGLLCD